MCDSISEIRNVMKNMSGDELAQTFHQALVSDSDPETRAAALCLVSEELAVRRTEGLGRKAERFLNRHGGTIGATALGFFLGAELGE